MAGTSVCATVRFFGFIINICFLLQPISNADFIVPVEIDGTIHQVYVLKRPFVDDFLQKMGELYECVLFTASLAKVRGGLFAMKPNMLPSNCTVYLFLSPCL